MRLDKEKEREHEDKERERKRERERADKERAYLRTKLDAGMWRYHANRMDARRSQFDLGRVDAYI